MTIKWISILASRAGSNKIVTVVGGKEKCGTIREPIVLYIEYVLSFHNHRTVVVTLDYSRACIYVYLFI